MRTSWWWMFVALALLPACEEEIEAVVEPEAVAPVEVSGDEPATDTVSVEGVTNVAMLQARVAELEQQLASCQGAPAPEVTPETATATPEGGTQVAAVPDGVDVPGNGSDSDGDSDSPSGSSGSDSSSNRSTRRRRSADRGLLGALLGDEEDDSSSGRRRRRAGDDDDADDSDQDTALPNPVDVLLGR